MINSTRHKFVTINSNNAKIVHHFEDAVGSFTMVVIVLGSFYQLIKNCLGSGNFELINSGFESTANCERNKCACVYNDHLAISKFVCKLFATIEYLFRGANGFSILSADNLGKFLELDMILQI